MGSSASKGEKEEGLLAHEHDDEEEGQGGERDDLEAQPTGCCGNTY